MNQNENTSKFVKCTAKAVPKGKFTILNIYAEIEGFKSIFKASTLGS